MRVLFLPDYTGANPYQRQLAKALEARGVRVAMAGAPRRNPAPILWGWLRRGCPRVVHLHWTHQYLGGADTTPGTLIRARFIGQLRLLRMLGVRLVWTVHNLGSHEGARDPAEMAVHRRLVELSNAVICHCEAAAGGGSRGIPAHARAQAAAARGAARQLPGRLSQRNQSYRGAQPPEAAP